MQFYFDDFCESYPERVDEHIFVTDYYAPDHPVDCTVRLDTPRYIGRVKSIGSECMIGSDVYIGNSVSIGNNVHIEDGVTLLRNVRLSKNLTVFSEVFMFEGAKVASPRRAIPHTFGRHIYEATIIGPGVRVPGEVQVGPSAVIPTSKAIAEIGPFGSSQRMVTVHGSDSGPKYNVGCQKGIDIDTFEDRILNAEETSPESAADYGRNLMRIVHLAEATQKAYERESMLVSELRDRVSVFNGEDQE